MRPAVNACSAAAPALFSAPSCPQRLLCSQLTGSVPSSAPADARGDRSLAWETALGAGRVLLLWGVYLALQLTNEGRPRCSPVYLSILALQVRPVGPGSVSTQGVKGRHQLHIHRLFRGWVSLGEGACSEAVRWHVGGCEACLTAEECVMRTAPGFGA